MILKYRMWNKITSKLHRVDGLYFDNKEVQYIDEVGILRFIKFENSILMQSTGLHDKNGKEIFEGDVIAIEVDDTGTPINARVFQNSKIGVLMFHVFEDNEDVPMVELLEDNSVAFEIIGNIYENPELLEVTE